MDTMTLLCNLHAEGPTTLRRLRQFGCGTFEDLLRTSTGRLAEALGMDEDGARRFWREAELLAQRCGSEGLEPEEMGGSVMSDSASLPTPGLEPPQVMATPPVPIVESLEPELLEGLDAQLCGELQTQGIVTLRQLWEASPLQLARETGRSLTELIDLQCAARNHFGAQRDSAAGGSGGVGAASARAASQAELVVPPPTGAPGTSLYARTPSPGELAVHSPGSAMHHTPIENPPEAAGPFV